MKDAQPFLLPVDPIALNIPHYPSIIKNPMDFGTIDNKLASSNLAKPDHNPDNPRYRHVDEFISDVRLIFSNCVTFNGPDHPVTAAGKRVEEVFDKQIKQMPASPEVCCRVSAVSFITYLFMHAAKTTGCRQETRHPSACRGSKADESNAG
jgi:Bromodomain